MSNSATRAGLVRVRSSVAAAAVLAAIMQPAVADARTSMPAAAERIDVVRASVTAAGRQIGGPSIPPVRGGLSGSGSRVVFTTSARGVVPSDTDRGQDVFVRDVVTGRTLRVSVPDKGLGRRPNGESWDPSISQSGNHVVFESTATNLVRGGNDAKDTIDVFVRDLRRGRTTRVSVGRGGKRSNSHSFFPVVSANGNIVAFQSGASNLVRGDTNRHGDVFVRNVRTGTTTRVSVPPKGKQFRGISLEPSISANGRYVLFAMTPRGDGNADLFVRDRRTQTTRRVFSEAQHGHAVVGSWNISANGRYVAFMTDAALVPDDTNGNFDAYRVTVATGAVVRASLTDGGFEAGGVTGRVAISGDGNRVAFSTQARGYTADDFGAMSDVFVRDLRAGTTVKVSVDRTGGQLSDHAGFQGYLGLSRDGRVASYESGAPDLVPGDTNRAADTFVARIG